MSIREPPPACCRAPKRPRRGVLGWIVPALLLIVLPKCPLCLAAYAAALGIGLSFEAASVLRTGIQVACVMLLALVIAKRLLR